MQEPVWLEEAADVARILQAGIALAAFALGYLVRGWRDRGDGE